MATLFSGHRTLFNRLSKFYLIFLDTNIGNDVHIILRGGQLQVLFDSTTHLTKSRNHSNRCSNNRRNLCSYTSSFLLPKLLSPCNSFMHAYTTRQRVPQILLSQISSSYGPSSLPASISKCSARTRERIPHIKRRISVSNHSTRSFSTSRTVLYATDASLADSSNSSKVKTKKETDGLRPLKLLHRPLGVPKPPRSSPLTTEERKAELLDPQKRLEKREILYVILT